MVDSQLRKAELRARLKALRNGLPAAERAKADAAICENVCSMPQFKEADVVLAYLSFGAEVETRGIIGRAWQEGKAVALPRCTGPHQMRWFTVGDLDGLQKSPLGVEEPPENDANELLTDASARMVALVPGLAFDAEGYRLGYGGGYYDAFLASFPGYSIGLCRNVQQVESLKELGAVGVHDIPVDMVVSE